MKKLALLLILAVIFAFAGCQGESSESETVYYKVSFVSDSGDTIEPQTVESGKTTTEPSKPTKTGYTFSAWYDGENAFDFSTPITKDTTLTAKWTANTYTVTLSNNGGESQVNVTFGEKLGDLESVPSMANSSFGGFYTEEYAKGEKFIDSDGKGCKAYEIASDTTLYAAWGYRISYENLRERENPNPEIYTGEEDIALLDLENIMGFAFAGWYDAETDGNKVETIAKGEYGAKTLYARWETTIFSTVSFDTKGIGEIASQTVGYTDKAVEPENPENYPYDLMGWYTSSDGGEALSENPFDFESEITEDVKLYAKWEIHATAADVTDKISAMQKSDTVFVSGEITNDRIKEIGTAIKAKSFGIALDLSDTTGLTSIEKYAFERCSSLTSIVIPDGVTSIGYSSFSDCSSLTNIEIPDSVTSIKEFAFSDCSSLTSIEIPDSVTSIKEFAFSDCSSLTSIEIPDSVTSIGTHGYGCSFSGCSRLTSIVIPDGVTSIRYSTFSGCSSLTSIEIPDSVTSIEVSAFSGCSSLTSIEIPDSVTSIEEYAFEDCSSLTNIEIPNCATPVKEYFPSYKNITNIKIASNVTSIKSSAFSDCSSITNFEIPSGVTSIGDGAFSSCSSLTSIEIPSGVTYIGDEAFKYCENLRSISMPEKLKTIGDFAFDGCYKLENITIPDGVTGIGKGAFAGCVSFTSITIPKSAWEAYSNTFNLFACCNNLKSVTILTTRIKFRDGMFKLCSNLERITFAGTVAEWNAHIADGANLTYGSVPATEVVCSDGTVPLN